MNKKPYVRLVAGMLIAGWLGLVATAQASVSATETMRSTVDNILSILKRSDMNWDNKRSEIKNVVDKRFYYRAMAQRTLSVNWRRASKEQQQRFTELFAQLLQNTYFERMKEYTNEKVEFLREKEKDNKAVVYTHIVTASNNIPIDYKLVNVNGEWLVYDVVIEEISLISNYRSSYREIVSRDGIDGLLKQMQQKLEDLTAAPTA